MTFYFYDVETSGRNPRLHRVMQFAGQRTDADLKPIGDPHNFLIKLTPDVLPEPDAILTNGIEPRKTIQDGITEAEFLKIFDKKIAIAGTVFVGYNNIRFDDEFIRFSLWRNFYDAYEWQWKGGSSRWDILDVARMARALRPDGLKWPRKDAGNRLEALARLNKLEHSNAHDALSDVNALIKLVKLIKDKQPKLFAYLLKMRTKNQLTPFIKSGEPFVYTSGRYPKEQLHTTVVFVVAAHPEKAAVLAYDLRIDPVGFKDKSVDELARIWLERGKDTPYFPIKELVFNRCAAVAPLSVLDAKTTKRLGLDMAMVNQNAKILLDNPDFGAKLVEAWQIVEQAKTGMYPPETEADAQLYDGFLSDSDRTKLRAVRAAKPSELPDFAGQFADGRLNSLLPLYKARNWPSKLSTKEQTVWQDFCRRRLTQGGENSQAAQFTRRLRQLEDSTLPPADRRLLEELSAYARSILPSA